jgi:hypothetical protein
VTQISAPKSLAALARASCSSSLSECWIEAEPDPDALPLEPPLLVCAMPAATAEPPSLSAVSVPLKGAPPSPSPSASNSPTESVVASTSSPTPAWTRRGATGPGQQRVRAAERRLPRSAGSVPVKGPLSPV